MHLPGVFLAASISLSASVSALVAPLIIPTPPPEKSPGFIAIRHPSVPTPAPGTKQDSLRARQNDDEPLCLPYQDPDGSDPCPSGAAVCCQCSGASGYFPTMSSTWWQISTPGVNATSTSGYNECGYTAIPSQSSSSTTPATSTAPMVTTDPYFGVVYDYTSASYLNVGGDIVTVPEGSSTPVSTIMSVYTTATAAWASASAAATEAASFDIQYCAYSSSFAGAALTWLVLIPKFQDNYDFATVDADFRGSLTPWAGCAGFSSYQAGSVGLYNTTFWAGFSTSIGCTAWDMTQIIGAAGAPKFGCSSYDGESGGVDPDTSNLDPATFPGADDGSEIP